MSERLYDNLFAISKIAALSVFAVAGAGFAYSAGGHGVLAEYANTVEIQHHEEDLRDKNLLPAILLEGAVAMQGIALLRTRIS